MILCQGEWILEDHLLLERGWEPPFPKALEEGRKPMEDLLDILFEELSKTLITSQGLDMISTIERGLILRALQKTKGNQVQAGLLLGMNRSTLRGKMERYHIKKDVLVSEEK
jgi:DNA-binding protein Fis